MLLASLDGVLGAPGATTIPVTDEGLLRGDGVFEVVRLYDGVPFALDDHLARLLRSADGMRLPVDLGAYVTVATRVLDNLKTLSYGGNMLAGRLAKEAGADEALLVTPHGRVLEGPTWSFFWVADGILRTPPLEERILASITRARLLECCDVREETLVVDDLRAAEEAFIASTVREVMPLAAIDGVARPAAPA